MKFFKHLLIFNLICFLPQNILIAEHIGTSLVNKVDRLLTAPSNNDRRVLALTIIGSGIVATGLYLTIIGGHQAATGRPEKEGSSESLAENIVRDGIARLSGFGLTMLGIFYTACGGATIILAKEAIFKLQNYLDRNYSYKQG